MARKNHRRLKNSKCKKKHTYVDSQNATINEIFALLNEIPIVDYDLIKHGRYKFIEHWLDVKGTYRNVFCKLQYMGQFNQLLAMLGYKFAMYYLLNNFHRSIAFLPPEFYTWGLNCKDADTVNTLMTKLKIDTKKALDLITPVLRDKRAWRPTITRTNRPICSTHHIVMLVSENEKDFEKFSGALDEFEKEMNFLPSECKYSFHRMTYKKDENFITGFMNNLRETSSSDSMFTFYSFGHGDETRSNIYRIHGEDIITVDASGRKLLLDCINKCFQGVRYKPTVVLSECYGHCLLIGCRWKNINVKAVATELHKCTLMHFTYPVSLLQFVLESEL